MRAQCSKPAVPAQGFATTILDDELITYADGYKSEMMLTYPSVAAPSCGWPLIVFVHGYGGRRAPQRSIASRGYAVVTYDVRGQGAARRLNRRPGTSLTMWGPVEKYDLAEVVAHARKTWPTLVSKTKLGVSGSSQGGIHPWFAAAYSGRSITVPGRGTITFPRVDVAAPQNFVPDPLDHFLRGGTLFSTDLLNRVTGTIDSAVVDPKFVALVERFFKARDASGLRRTLDAEPGRSVRSLLAQSRVPISSAHAYTDSVMGPLDAVQSIATMSSQVPLRAVLSTRGHGSPLNQAEGNLRDQERHRWFDRYLWDIKNGVENESRSIWAVFPPETSTFQDAKSLWGHRDEAGIRPAGRVARTRYLGAGGQLRATQGNGAASVLKHRVAANFTPTKYWTDATLRTMAGTLAAVPLDEHVWQETLARQTEFVGVPSVELSVVPNAERFTVYAMLSARLPGATQDFMLSRFGRGVVGARANVAMTLRFELGPLGVVLPRGTVLKLTLRNHWLREAPMQRRIVSVPYFTPSDVAIQTSSKLILPASPRVGVDLLSSSYRIQASRPANVDFVLRGGNARNSSVYVILASLSGRSPGLQLPGDTLPLNFDPLTALFLQLASTPNFRGFVGSFDAKGEASARATLSRLGTFPPALVGQRLSFAAWAFDANAGIAGRASNPHDVTIR